MIPDTETDAGPRNTKARMRLEDQLFLLVEGSRPRAGGSRHGLTGLDEVALGRADARAAERIAAPQRRLAIGVPDPRMSSSHAILRRDEGGWTIEDAGSRNGSRVNGATVRSHRLRDGDLIELGRTTFLYRAGIELPLVSPVDLSSTDLLHRPLALRTLIPALAADLETSMRVAGKSPVPVLLLGETGSGKEILARAIHETSARKGRMVAVNCGALPSELVESQLFGHAKGAFTGALKDELGLVRAAHHGTLFLDEIGDLLPSSQAALLRVLQEREVTPVGTTEAHAVDVRLVSATHIALEQRVRSGAFREDLLARLAGHVHRLAPMRERREDLGVLIAALLDKIGAHERLTISTAAVRAMALYDWPRNVRELEHCLSVACAVGEAEIDLPHLPEYVRAGRKGRPAQRSDDEELESALVSALEEHGGNVSAVARSMGKARMQVQRWMKRFAIDPEAFKK